MMWWKISHGSGYARIPDSVFDHADQVEVIRHRTRGFDRPDERGKDL